MGNEKQSDFDFFKLDEPKLSMIDRLKLKMKPSEMSTLDYGLFWKEILILRLLTGSIRIVSIFFTLLLISPLLVNLAFAIDPSLSLVFLNAYDLLMPLMNLVNK